MLMTIIEEVVQCASQRRAGGHPVFLTFIIRPSLLLLAQRIARKGKEIRKEPVAVLTLSLTVA
jgi:hypothetical protein